MKVNREQFLAAAFLFATTAGTTGCGKLAERMKGEFNASQDPAAAPIEDGPTTNGASDPAAIARTTNAKTAGTPVAKNAPVAVKTTIGGPAKEGVGPASENIAPAKEGVGPAKEAGLVGPSNENIAPAKEGWARRTGPASEGVGPANESAWRRRGPASETAAGPTNEAWRGRPGPASENIPPPKPTVAKPAKPPPAPKKAKTG